MIKKKSQWQSYDLSLNEHAVFLLTVPCDKCPEEFVWKNRVVTFGGVDVKKVDNWIGSDKRVSGFWPGMVDRRDDFGNSSGEDSNMF